jgi:TonB-dependent SusC/RagA subfamily outer membrane receptor
MRKFTCWLFFTGFFMIYAYGQKTDVSGRVVDTLGNPISNVSIKVQNARTGTVTDNSGFFKLSVEPGARLEISSIGYRVQQIAASPNVTVTLLSDNASLTEVVVTALGIRREKKSLGYAVSTIDKRQLESRPEPDLGRLLSGKAPGVDILATSGISGSGTNIQIRGANSITGNSDPLFVVDGAPISGATNQQTNAIYGSQTSSRFLDIDPNNIESVNILKGLSATVLYGEAGRNGVILITYLFGAFSPLTGDNHLLEMPHCNSHTFQEFINYLSRQRPSEFKLLILDNGAFHHAKSLIIPANMAFIFLPPYSPELNPAEKIWRYFKDRVSMIAYPSLDMLQLQLSFITKQMTTDLIKSICGNEFYKATFKGSFNV